MKMFLLKSKIATIIDEKFVFLFINKGRKSCLKNLMGHKEKYNM